MLYEVITYRGSLQDDMEYRKFVEPGDCPLPAEQPVVEPIAGMELQ